MEGKKDEFTEYCEYVVESGPFDGFKAVEHVIYGKQGSTVTVEKTHKVHNF